jgi:hypothetical protein
MDPDEVGSECAGIGPGASGASMAFHVQIARRIGRKGDFGFVRGTSGSFEKAEKFTTCPSAVLRSPATGQHASAATTPSRLRDSRAGFHTDQPRTTQIKIKPTTALTNPTIRNVLSGDCRTDSSARLVGPGKAAKTNPSITNTSPRADRNSSTSATAAGPRPPVSEEFPAPYPTDRKRTGKSRSRA